MTLKKLRDELSVYFKGEITAKMNSAIPKIYTQIFSDFLNHVFAI